MDVRAVIARRAMLVIAILTVLAGGRRVLVAMGTVEMLRVRGCDRRILVMDLAITHDTDHRLQ